MRDQDRMWDLLTGRVQRYQQEYADYYRRNPPRQMRPRWQQAVILAVPVAVFVVAVGLLF